jgi:hypothetical protein
LKIIVIQCKKVKILLQIYRNVLRVLRWQSASRIGFWYVDPFASKYIKTELTGRFLDKAILDFDQTTGEPMVSLQFDEEGSLLFEKITKETEMEKIEKIDNCNLNAAKSEPKD